MKIIHTSDWHLGRKFGPVSLRSDQEAFTDWFVDLVADERADLVIIAGDLYDRAIAPTHSIELFRTTVRRLLDAGAVVAAISGNHDGADRVSPYDDLLDRSGLYLRGGYQRVGEVIRHQFTDGPLDLVLLPFLDPQAAPDDLPRPEGAGEDEDDHGTGGGDEADDPSDLVERRRRRTHQSVLEAAVAIARPQLDAPRSLAVAHAFVTGSTTSESERQLVVGGTGEVGASVFDGFSYTALGHLHRPQHVAGRPVAYSGTPLAYSFSEEHQKSVVIVEMDGEGAVETSTIDVPVGRKVATITGTIDELLAPDAHPHARDAFVRAVVTDRETVLDAKAKLAQHYPHVIEVRLQPLADEADASPAPPEISELEPIEATRQFWAAAEGERPSGPVDELLVAATAKATAGADR